MKQKHITRRAFALSKNMKTPRIITTIFGAIIIGTVLNFSSAYADTVEKKTEETVVTKAVPPVKDAKLSALEAWLEKAEGQQDMNISSGELAAYLDTKLTEKEAEMVKNYDSEELKLFQEGSKEWRVYRKAQSEFEAHRYRWVSVGPAIANDTFIRITQERLADLSLASWTDPSEEIKQLTPEMAKLLLHSFDRGDIGGLSPYVGSLLDLGGLTSLDTETVEVLAEFDGDMSLGGLTSLDVETAKAIAELHSTSLRFDSLTTLDAETAKALARFSGLGLRLHLTTLDAETAKALAAHKGHELYLTEFKGHELDLSGLTTLDAETAKALAEFKGDFLDLGGLTKLDAETAKALAEFKGRCLDLNGLTKFDAEAAKALAEFKGGNLRLSRLATLDAETAKAVVAAVEASRDHRYVMKVFSLGVEGDWAYVLCLPKAKNPKHACDGQLFALLRKVGGSWKVLEAAAGSDIDLVQSVVPTWKKKYPEAPDKLLHE